jgi:long-subunit fatty acid transport protein
MKHFLPNLILLILLFVFQSSIFAGDPTFRSVPRARTLSLNGLYIAGIDGTNGSLSNAASLAYFKSNTIELSFVDMIGQPEIDNPTNGLYNAFQQDNVPFTAGFILPLSENLVIALSYQQAYSYNVNWPYAVLTSTDSSSYLQTFDLYNRINVGAILPSISLKLGKISFGATFDIYNVDYETAFPISNPNWGDTLGLPIYQMQYDMSNWCFGFNVGLMVEILEDLRFGAFVRSGFSSDLDGIAQSDFFGEVDSIASSSSVSTNYRYPWVFGAGVLYNLAPDLSINIDALYSLFSSNKSLDMTFSDPDWEAKNLGIDPLMGINPSNILLDFEDAIDIGIGLEYISSSWSFRSGYRFSQTQNSETSYNFLFPTVDRHWISLGFGYHDSIYYVDFGAAYAFGVNRTINSYIPISGNYDSETIDVSLTLKYVF